MSRLTCACFLFFAGLAFACSSSTAPSRSGALEPGAAAPAGGAGPGARPDELIPRPVSVRPGTGEFIFTPGVTIRVDDAAGAEGRAAADWFSRMLAGAAGFPVPVLGSSAAPDGRALELALDPGVAAAEGYRLTVTADRIRIEAPSAAGLFHGLQTLRQLLPPEIEAGAPVAGVIFRVPAVEVEDAPRFPYRGMMLDVSRHFFPVAFIKRTIDLAALFKMNHFHWHLTDDQGWRLEIKKYPRLTEIGAFRDEGGARTGGYYTQDEVRDVVAYAAERFVTVVPEIEMPGHCLAALAAYPEFACTPGPFTVPSDKGIYDGVFCPTEATFGFIADVLDEVVALFPGRRIHIGGDEVVTDAWRSSPLAQAVMAREGLASAAALFGYFNRRVADLASQRGRDIIGWDEILDSDLPPGATVMSWRGTQGGVRAAQLGHDAIMTPSSICYLEHYQAGPAGEPRASGSVMTLAKVYAWNPVPRELDAEAATHILGSEGILWTELIATPEHAEYMLYPRALALAEVLWSPEAARDYPGFLLRLQASSARLDVLGVPYATHFRQELPAASPAAR